MPLSLQQYRVLHSLISGHSYQQIAEELEITQSTVKYHARRIYQNAGVKTRSQLMAKLLADLLKTGWVEKMLDKYHDQTLQSEHSESAKITPTAGVQRTQRSPALA